jgi:hypothetical protein
MYFHALRHPYCDSNISLLFYLIACSTKSTHTHTHTLFFSLQDSRATRRPLRTRSCCSWRACACWTYVVATPTSATPCPLPVTAPLRWTSILALITRPQAPLLSNRLRNARLSVQLHQRVPQQAAKRNVGWFPSSSAQQRSDLARSDVPNVSFDSNSACD